MKITRDSSGVPRLKGKCLMDAMFQLGTVHATDRAAQMAMTRILGQGRACECLLDNEQLLQVDRYFKWLGLYRGAAAEIQGLSDREKRLIETYCDGVNAAMAKNRTPFPFRVWGYKWEPWQPEDMVLMLRIMAWFSLVSAQVNVEKAVIDLILQGVAEPLLKELFSPHLEGCDFELIRKITLTDPLLPQLAEIGKALSAPSGSNNWVVAGILTASGTPMLASDPHLEVNRLPPVWYEVVMELEDDYLMGITVPGLPAFIIGRNQHLSWGITYTEADQTDFFVEECKDGLYLKAGEWQKFEELSETVQRKKHPAEIVKIYKNEHGLLLGDPYRAGKYLSLAWTAWHSKFSDVIQSVLSINEGKTVTEAMEAVKQFHYPALNWVFADRAGNIGYRMAGLFPIRREGISGLYPVPGWEAKNDWQGWIAPEDLPSSYNPPQGFFHTANQDLSAHGQVSVQNCPMSHYRGDRIKQLLSEWTEVTARDMMAIQLDLHSRKAEIFVPIFLRYLPRGTTTKLLANWDFKYEVDSTAATAFEALYREALFAVFCQGEDSIPQELLRYLLDETSVFLNTEAFWDQILLSDRSAWFGKQSRDQLLRPAFEKLKNKDFEPWGQKRLMTMTNIFFQGKLPGFLGFDKGPFKVAGSTNTPKQGTIYKDGGRVTTFCPSYRFITDLGTDEAFTIMPGGPSEKRFSKYYISDLKGWLEGTYKQVNGRLPSDLKR